MEIEYKITLEDEINSLEADRDYLAHLPLRYWQYGYIFPLAFLLMSTPGI